ncbi:MAG: molybdopterin molybdotransferase MoeA [Coriobacteriia bacterium]|nr:molybdopterin molybdotransferase MoeA [Coriobacteriia bacterium]MCL2750855.1 molybdopterin molybdotransferase MoeA [Coriobacteriia bacterium]
MSNHYESSETVAVRDAIEKILSFAKVLEPQSVPMQEAMGRVLAQDIVSDRDIAPFANSAMDGFALKAADIEQASPKNPAQLKVLGIIGAGSVFEGTVQSGEALRIMTGAMMPAGADTVVMIEKVEVTGVSAEKPEGTQVILTAGAKLGLNVRDKGEEALAGDLLLKAGTVVNAAGIGLLAATGNPHVEVIRRPRVAILSSGDELVGPSEVPGPGQIRNSNCYSLAAAVKAAGGEPNILGIVRDNNNEILQAIQQAVAHHDMVLISGGAAGGDYDFTYQVLSELGTVHFCKVNMRPGKAQTLGIVNNTIVFGLAGNPSAAMVGFEVLLRPALRQMQGFTSIKRPVTKARLTTDAYKPDSRRFYLRARVERDKASGEYLVTPEKNQSSALLSALQNANCLVVLQEGLDGKAKSEMVCCIRLDIDEGVEI